MSQNKAYSDFLKMMAALVGIPPNRITTELEAMWRVLFNNAIADIWERGPFLEISPYGEARFVDNHLDYPNNQKASAWVPTGVELTRNAVVNPLDWRINATEMLETSDVSEHKVVQTVDKWIPGVQYEASFYARYKGRPLISLEVWDGVEEYYGTFNILTGAVAAYSSTVTATIQQVANNFYYCKIKFTTDPEASVTGTYTIRLSGEDTNQFVFVTDDGDTLVTSDGDTLVTDCESRCLYWNTEQTCEVDVCTPAPESLSPPVLSINVDQADDTMELTWVNGETYDSLYLERGTDGTNFSALATLAGNDTAYDDTDVLLAVTYYYRIRGKVGDEYTAYSNIVSGTLTIAAPVLSLAVDDENDQMDLSWTNGEPDYTNLYLERGLDGVTFSPLVTLPGNDTSEVDSDVELEVTYYYRIRGLVDGSYSAYSNIVSGTLEPDPADTPGSLWGWGQNETHQLGVGDDLRRTTPALVEEAEPALDWVKISLGRYHGMGVKDNGTLWAWGQNFSGQLGNGLFTVYPDTANDFYRPTQIGSDTDWLTCSVNTEYSMALKTDGTLWTWGNNGAGQLGLGLDTETNVNTPTQVGVATNWVAIAAGKRHCLVLNEDGELWGSGNSTQGQLGSGPLQTDVLIQVPGVWATMSAGDDTSYGIKADGTLWRIGTLPNGTIAQIGTDTHWVSVQGGGSQNNIAVLKNDGTLWTMGGNSVGQLGLGDTTERTLPTQVGEDTWLDYSVHIGSHMVAVKTDGSMWGWGADGNYTEGQGVAQSIRSSPVQIGPDNFWVKGIAGYTATMGVRSTLDAPPPPAGTSGVLLGGYVTVVGGRTIHLFSGGSGIGGSGTVQVIDGDGVSFDVVWIGAGGGGGPLGGGGAGRFIKQTGLTFANGDYPYVVGARGVGGGGTSTPGGDGGSTIFNGVTAIGGGGGGCLEDDATRFGRNGASGGGGGGETSGVGAAGGTGSFGNNGGSGTGGGSQATGGGGGGFDSPGTNSSSNIGGTGGDGIEDAITGITVAYCAGGGGFGGAEEGSVAGQGGSDDGFGFTAGGTGATGGGLGGWGNTPGSGGGGSTNFAGEGGLGALIISYLTPA